MVSIYSEIHVLRKMLEKAQIPFDMSPLFGGYQICYPSHTNVICSVIEHDGSYGHHDDLLEVMGLLTKEEAIWDDVVGNLTAEDVFNRIKKTL